MPTLMVTVNNWHCRIQEKWEQLACNFISSLDSYLRVYTNMADCVSLCVGRHTCQARIRPKWGDCCWQRSVPDVPMCHTFPERTPSAVQTPAGTHKFVKSLLFSAVCFVKTSHTGDLSNWLVWEEKKNQEHIFRLCGAILLFDSSVYTYQALKMKYFSNRPGPTPGPQLPRPNYSADVLREKETAGLKRKIEGLETSNEKTDSYLIFLTVTQPLLWWFGFSKLYE